MYLLFYRRRGDFLVVLNKMKKFFVIVLLILFGAGFLVFAFFFVGKPKQAEHITWGATFSHSYAEGLGLNWEETYLALLDDLKIRNFRIPLYWDELEPHKGHFVFSNWDWQLEELEKRNGKAILAIGFKLPRWPECRMPEWAKVLSKEDREEAILSMLKQIAEHYKDSKVVEKWQVENEYLVPFGICPEPDKNFLFKELRFVKRLDSRPVITTDAGIASFWLTVGKHADEVGFSIYRFRVDDEGKFIKYPFPPVTYYRKAQFFHLFHPKKEVVAMELQAEPWPVTGTIEGDYKTMSPEQFGKHIEYAKQTGFDTFYFWGAEWWYWAKEKGGDPAIWNEAKNLFEKR
ncbi:MAG: beta-galactosidase [Candidatus Wildermuthbacteria bacterium]|nr:beta-galactosidase [Candidatus Wildermuthbacteria bacterium]